MIPPFPSHFQYGTGERGIKIIHPPPTVARSWAKPQPAAAASALEEEGPLNQTPLPPSIPRTNKRAGSGRYLSVCPEKHLGGERDSPVPKSSILKRHNLMAKKIHLYPHKIERVLLLILGNPFTIIGWSMTKPTMIHCRPPPSRLLEQHGSITKFSLISFFPRVRRGAISFSPHSPPASSCRRQSRRRRVKTTLWR